MFFFIFQLYFEHLKFWIGHMVFVVEILKFCFFILFLTEPAFLAWLQGRLPACLASWPGCLAAWLPALLGGRLADLGSDRPTDPTSTA